MDKTITTTLLIVISLIMALMLFNVMYPAVLSSSDSINGMTSRANDRIKTQINVIHAAGELNSAGTWQDSNMDSQFEVFFWIKNIGATRIIALDNLDIFFGEEGNFTRIPHQTDAGTSFPYWTWQLENADQWTPTATVKITIHTLLPLPRSRYLFKVTLPNGVSDDYLMSL